MKAYIFCGEDEMPPTRRVEVFDVRAALTPSHALAKAAGPILCALEVYDFEEISDDEILAKYWTVSTNRDATPVIRRFMEWCVRGLGNKNHSDPQEIKNAETIVDNPPLWVSTNALMKKLSYEEFFDNRIRDFEYLERW